MKHPLENFPHPVRKPFFYAFLALTFIIFATFNQLDQPLRTTAAPNGIVSYELAWNETSAQAMLDSWNADAKLNAAFGLGFDYLFMPVYAFTLSFGLLLARRTSHRVYDFLGWAVFLAPLFDAAENYALWFMLKGGAVFPYPLIASICASVKFILLIIGLLAALWGAVTPRK